jgi:hypothetical protein
MRARPWNTVLAGCLFFASLAAGCGGRELTTDIGSNSGDASTDSASGGADASLDSPGDASAGDGTVDGGGGPGSDGGGAACPSGGATTITGQVLDPAGHNPIYGVTVYTPNSALSPITTGVDAHSCGCNDFSGQPTAVTTTDADGNFTLRGAMAGTNVPLVVQIGKWRKQINVPSVTSCVTTSAGAIALPKSMSDTSGTNISIPSIAVATGAADTLECVLTRIGLDASAFTGTPGATPGVHVYQGSGGNAAAGSPASSTLWASTQSLEQYDLVMLSCEGQPTTSVTGSTAPILADYVSAGGRVYAEHYGYAFFTGASGSSYPAFTYNTQQVADWINVPAGNDSPYATNLSGVIETTLPSGGGFPEGAAFAQWLKNVKALNGSAGGGTEIDIPVANARCDAVIPTSGSYLATPWVQTDPSISPASTQMFSWDMPFGAPLNDGGVPAYCGRVVYSDMHDGNSSDYVTGTSVPSGCGATAALLDEEKAMEFMLFNLSACIVPPGQRPTPPPGNGNGCVIGSVSIASGALNPNNACQVCEPSISTNSWTMSSDGAPCGTGEVCVSGACTAVDAGATVDAGGTASSDAGTLQASCSSSAITACDGQSAKTTCVNCCQTSCSTGFNALAQTLAACLCNGGPCSTACSAAGDFCATPGNIASAACTTCFNNYTAAGATCDPSGSKIASPCTADVNCAAYMKCANACP